MPPRIRGVAYFRAFLVFFLTARFGCGGVASIRRSTASVAGSSLGEGLGMDEVDSLKGHPAIARVIGNVVMSFSQFEYALCGNIFLIYHCCGGRKKIDPEIPVSFKKRATFMRKAAKTLPILAPCKPEILSLMREASRIARLRSQIVHSAVGDYNGQTRKWTFANLGSRRRGTSPSEEFELTVADLLTTIEDTIKISERAFALFKQVRGLLSAQHHANNLAGGVGWKFARFFRLNQ